MSFHRTTEPVENLGILQDFLESDGAWPELLVNGDLDCSVAGRAAFAKKLFDHGHHA